MSNYYQQPLPPASHAHPLLSSTAPAQRLAATIGVVKWALVALYMLAATVTFVGAGAVGEVEALAVVIPVCMGLTIAAAMTWAAFGWAQHTLSMLALIARNTGSRQ